MKLIISIPKAILANSSIFQQCGAKSIQITVTTPVVPLFWSRSKVFLLSEIPLRVGVWYGFVTYFQNRVTPRASRIFEHEVLDIINLISHKCVVARDVLSLFSILGVRHPCCRACFMPWSSCRSISPSSTTRESCRKANVHLHSVRNG